MLIKKKESVLNSVEAFASCFCLLTTCECTCRNCACKVMEQTNNQEQATGYTNSANMGDGSFNYMQAGV